jgi:hypothetical protein
MHTSIAVPVLLVVSIAYSMLSTSTTSFRYALALEQDGAVVPAKKTGVATSAEADLPFGTHLGVIAVTDWSCRG